MRKQVKGCTKENDKESLLASFHCILLFYDTTCLYAMSSKRKHLLSNEVKIQSKITSYFEYF